MRAFAVIPLGLLLYIPASHAQDSYQGSADSPPPPTGTTEKPSASGASDAAPVTVKGSFFSRYEAREGYDEIGRVGRRFGEGDGVAYRARISVKSADVQLRHGRTLQYRFVPQASGFWGDVSGGLTDAGLGIHEADLRLVDPSWSVQVGRFEMNYGDHLVIGNVGWHETGRSFDGIRFRQKLSKAKGWVDLFLTQVAEGGAGLAPSAVYTDGDNYFAGVYAGLGPLVEEGTDIEAYLLSNIAPRSTPDDGTAMEATIGGRGKKALGKATVRAELGVQLGKRPGSDANVLAFQADGDAFFKVGSKAKLGVGALFASGDDPDTEDNEAWNQLYPTAHKFLGLMDVFGARSNVMSGILKARLATDSSWKFAADAHLVARPQTPDGVDAYAGAEADLWSHYSIGEGFGLRTQYSILVPNSSGPFATDDPMHYVEVQLRFDQK